MSFFVYGFPKSERENITAEELKAFRDLAKLMLGYSDEELNKAVANDKLRELDCND